MMTTAELLAEAMRAASADTAPLRERIAELEAAVLGAKVLLEGEQDVEAAWQVLDQAYHQRKP